MARRLLILTYHRILPKADPLRDGCFPVDVFAAHMRVLARFFNVLPLADAVDRLQRGTLPARAVSITFDDGYADNYTLAGPVLRKLDLPWTIFVATGYLDGGRMWNDTIIDSVEQARQNTLDLRDLGLDVYPVSDIAARRSTIGNLLGKLKHTDPGKRDDLACSIANVAKADLSNDLMLTSEQLMELARDGVAVGGHTVTHPILKVIDHDTARWEIATGKQHLESLIGTEVRLFAYPNGRPKADYDETHAEFVRQAGFICAVSTEPGAASQSSDLFQLPRFGPWAESSVKFGLRSLRLLM